MPSAGGPWGQRGACHGSRPPAQRSRSNTCDGVVVVDGDDDDDGGGGGGSDDAVQAGPVHTSGRIQRSTVRDAVTAPIATVDLRD